MTDILEQASRVAAMIELRGCLMRFAPGMYSPEMTDDEAVELVKELFRQLAPAIEEVAARLDENRPGWRERAAG